LVVHDVEVFIVMTLLGVLNGPLDIAMFTLRQRRTAPEWVGRAFAVSVSVNWIGSPIGSAAAGVLVPAGAVLPLVIAMVCGVAGAAASDH